MGKTRKKRKTKGGNTMATQIAVTPIMHGKEARKILKEAKTTQSAKSRENAKNIINYFNKFTNQGD